MSESLHTNALAISKQFGGATSLIHEIVYIRIIDFARNLRLLEFLSVFYSATIRIHVYALHIRHISHPTGK